MTNNAAQIIPFEKPMNIYQKINCVMKEVDYIQKSAKKVNNQYTYVSHDQVTAKLHEPLTRNGIVVTNSVVDLVQEGNRTTAKIEVCFINIDNPQDTFKIISYGYGIDSADKGPGKAISYAYKYALLKTFCLETGDDPDHDQNVQFNPEEKPLSEKDAIFRFKETLENDDKEIFDEYLNEFVKNYKVTKISAINKFDNKREDFAKHFSDWKSGK